VRQETFDLDKAPCHTERGPCAEEVAGLFYWDGRRQTVTSDRLANTAYFMSDIFISYASEDGAIASQIATALTGRGWSVFWDRTIPPGETWDIVIERELTDAKCAVVLWSRSSVQSKWVKAEAGDAAERNVLIPAFIEEVRPPLRFRDVQGAQLIGWSGDVHDSEFTKLCESVSDVIHRSKGSLPGHGTDSQGTSPSSPQEPPARPRIHKTKLVLASVVGSLLALVILKVIFGWDPFPRSYLRCSENQFSVSKETGFIFLPGDASGRVTITKESPPPYGVYLAMSLDHGIITDMSRDASSPGVFSFAVGNGSPSATRVFETPRSNENHRYKLQVLRWSWDYGGPRPDGGPNVRDYSAKIGDILKSESGVPIGVTIPAITDKGENIPADIRIVWSCE